MPGEVGQLGEYLADARALDTNRAHALWLDEGAQDPWMLAAALVTVTSRARLGVTVPPDADPATLVSRLRTLAQLSRGRVDLRGSAASVETARSLVRAADGCRFIGEGDDGALAAFRGLADGLVLSGREPDEDRARIGRARDLVGAADPSAPLECWVRIKLPESHADWRRALVAYEAAGADGLLVPLDARLVDLLRRADEEDDRSDLTLSQG